MSWLLLLVGQLVDSNHFSSGLQEAALQATVQIVATKGSERYTGTGTIVAMQGSDAIILTAEHVIPQSDNFRITFWPHDAQAEYSDTLTVLYQSVAADLALVRVAAPATSPRVLRICPLGVRLRPTFPVLTVGCSGGNPPSCETATVMKSAPVQRAAGRGLCWVIDNGPAKGRSGGLMMDTNSYLIGVGSCRDSDKGYYSSITEIHAFCDSANFAWLYRSGNGREARVEASPVTIRATLAMERPAAWTDPSCWEAEARISMTLDVTSDQDRFLAPIPFIVRASDGIRLIEGFEPFEIHGAGKIEVPLTIGLKAQHETPVSLTIEPLSKSEYLTFEPARLTANMTIAPPSRVTTTVRAVALRVGPARWLDLTAGTASIDAVVHVQVDGPLGQTSKLAVTAPPGVRRLTLSKDVIRTGEQTVEMKLVAVLPPGPRRTLLRFQLQAIPQGAIDVQIADAIDVTVTGPAPSRLVLAQGTVPCQVFAGTLPGDGSPAVITVNPVLTDVSSRTSAPGLAARLAVGAPMHTDSPELAPLFSPIALRIGAQQHSGTQSFFRDGIVKAKLTVTPATPCAAVVGSEHTLILKQDAPFKRLLFILATGVCIAVFCFLPVRFFWRLGRDSSYEESPTFEVSRFNEKFD